MQSIGGGASRLRQVNREIILHQLRTGGPMTKAALASATRLSLATCGNILTELVGTGEAVELEERESAGGRPARRYAVNPAHRLAAALSTERLGNRESLTLAVVNGVGEFIHQETHKAKVTVELLDATLAAAREKFPAIRAATLSVPGWIAHGQIGSCDNPALVGERLEERLRQSQGIEIAVENDTNLAALGYYASRSDLAQANMVYFAFIEGCCPGAGVIVNGMLVRGHTGFAGEVSHIPLAGGRQDGGDLPRPKQLRQVAEMVAAAAALINPEVVVLSGERTDGFTPGEIAVQCAKIIPEQHIPELVIRADLSHDRLAGAAAMALRMQSCEVGLVLKKRTWCDDE